MSPALTSLHLFEVGPSSVPEALARMALDRGRLRRTPGVAFAKLLGTSDGRTFRLRDSDPLRWGLVAVWSTPGALADFERRSAIAASWRGIARAVWRFDLLPMRSRGSWSGRSPFPQVQDVGTGGAVAALTRARIRPLQWRTFWRAVPAVAASAHDSAGLRFSVGIGEAPIGLQGTFSVWESAEALRAFAYRGAAHRSAINDTQQRGWYAEELFVRFSVLQVTCLRR